MNPNWSEFQSSFEQKDALLLKGMPSVATATYDWPDHDFAGWARAFQKLGVRVVYAIEVTVGDHVEVLRQQFDEVRDLSFTEADDAEADAIERMLDETAAAQGDDSVGWMGEWWHGGVAHRYMATEIPSALVALDSRIEAYAVTQPSSVDRRSLRLVNWAEQRAEATRAKQERSELAASALAGAPDFAGCTNYAQRKNLLATLAREQNLDLDGVNREEVIAAAKAMLTK